MLIVKIVGGLGNQLFQYAFGKSIEKRTGIKVYYDIEDFEVKYKLRKFSLKHFNVKLSRAEPTEINRLNTVLNKVLFKIYRASNGLIVSKKQLKYYSEKGSLFDSNAFAISNNDIYLNGYWQSEKYFKDISEVIREDFKITSSPNAANQEALKRIADTNSVSLHIRRGDFVSNPTVKQIYNTLSLEYYESAINYIKERVTDPVFFVFSDDIEWVKANLKNKHTLVFMSHNADSDYEDMRLMSECKHNITANSTFSWWGAWLNANKQKIVISPKKWFIDKEHSSVDLVLPDWIQL